MTVRFLAEAEVGLADGVAYYDGLLPGLGTEFALGVRDGLARVGAAQRLFGRQTKVGPNAFSDSRCWTA